MLLQPVRRRRVPQVRLIWLCRRAPARRRLLERLNPLLTIILAFWALWHCRHARPPDAVPDYTITVPMPDTGGPDEVLTF